MDPLLLEALRFGIAILAGGIVAVISSVLAFRYTRRLQLEDAARRDQALRRALIAEIRENMHRIGGPEVTQGPVGGLVRSAWDQARSLPLADEVFRTIAQAYAIADGVNAEVALLTARAASKGIVKSDALEAEIGALARNMIAQDSRNARAAFAVALRRLGEPVPEVPASAQEGVS